MKRFDSFPVEFDVLVFLDNGDFLLVLELQNWFFGGEELDFDVEGVSFVLGRGGVDLDGAKHKLAFRNVIDLIFYDRIGSFNLYKCSKSASPILDVVFDIVFLLDFNNFCVVSGDRLFGKADFIGFVSTYFWILADYHLLLLCLDN